jgi:hypothetical protein
MCRSFRPATVGLTMCGPTSRPWWMYSLRRWVKWDPDGLYLGLYCNLWCHHSYVLLPKFRSSAAVPQPLARRWRTCHRNTGMQCEYIESIQCSVYVLWILYRYIHVVSFQKSYSRRLNPVHLWSVHTYTHTHSLYPYSVLFIYYPHRLSGGSASTISILFKSTSSWIILVVCTWYYNNALSVTSVLTLHGVCTVARVI